MNGRPEVNFFVPLKVVVDVNKNFQEIKLNIFLQSRARYSEQPSNAGAPGRPKPATDRLQRNFGGEEREEQAGGFRPQIREH